MVSVAEVSMDIQMCENCGENEANHWFGVWMRNDCMPFTVARAQDYQHVGILIETWDKKLKKWIISHWESFYGN